MLTVWEGPNSKYPIKTARYYDIRWGVQIRNWKKKKEFQTSPDLFFIIETLLCQLSIVKNKRAERRYSDSSLVHPQNMCVLTRLTEIVPSTFYRVLKVRITLASFLLEFSFFQKFCHRTLACFCHLTFINFLLTYKLLPPLGSNLPFQPWRSRLNAISAK